MHLFSIHTHNLFLLAHGPCWGRALPSNQPFTPSSWSHFIFSILLHVPAFWPSPNAENQLLLPEAREKATQHTLMKKALPLAMFSTCQSKSAAMCHPCHCPQQCLWGHKTWQVLEQRLMALVCISSHSPCYCQHTLRQKPLSSQNTTYWHIRSPTTGNGRFWNSKFFPCMLVLFFLYFVCPPLSQGADEHKILWDTCRAELHLSVQPTHVTSLLELTLQRQHN